MELVSANTTQQQQWTPEAYEPTEREKLEQLWNSGHLQRHIAALEKFYRKNRHQLEALIASRSQRPSLVELAKHLVIEARIIDRTTEIADQIADIETEIWIQGERGNYDRDRIVAEWAAQHAAQWRHWRIKEYLFATEHMEDVLLGCLQKAS